MAVLVVDDEEAVRASVADVIRTVGYTVIESSDGEDALRLLSTMRFHAIVLDLHMPRLGGVALLSALPKPPPVVVLSGYELEEESRRQVGRAIVTYLRKPVPPRVLLDALADAVGLEHQL
jgi:CheY-like chemotaxis protein